MRREDRRAQDTAAAEGQTGQQPNRQKRVMVSVIPRFVLFLHEML